MRLVSKATGPLLGSFMKGFPYLDRIWAEGVLLPILD